MKISISLLLLSLGLAFGAGYFALQIRQSEGRQLSFSISEMTNIKIRFREKNRVVEELDAMGVFSPQSGIELLDPSTVLSPSKGRSFSAVSSVFRADKLCQPNLITDSSLAKVKLWIRFRCQKISQLPPGFFEQPPYMSPFGISFVNLAYFSGLKNYNNTEWLKSNIRYLHSLEFSSLPSNIELDGKRQILSRLGIDTLRFMVSGRSWIANENYIFVRRNSEPNGSFQRSVSTADYLIYNRSDWDQFLNGYGVEIEDRPASGCAYQDDGLCWVKTSTSEKKIQWAIGILFLLAVGIIVFCVLQIIRNIKNQRLEEERTRFALQALTHELRTPLASLVISSEQVFDQFEDLPASMKEPFLRIADDVHRLARVAESSQNYLRASDSRGLILFNFVKIDSINDFVASTIERYEGEVKFKKLDFDTSCTLDQYWIAICIQNLIQNAIQHGASPIEIELSRNLDSLIISVSDAGEMNEIEVVSVARPFVKRPRSTGLGLGLTIVDTVMAAMNSRLRISTKPTRFELRIGGVL